MASYKVPQDVEAEDKFLGPLTFKQFLFMGGAAVLGYIMFLLYTKNVGFLIIVFLPFFILCLVLAFPWSSDQPTELWLASRIRFMIVPRKRIWDQSGVKDLVTITVPKREAHIYTDGLSQSEVKNRLGALASVVDSRGWAVRNIMDAQNQQGQQSDRLVQQSSAPLTGSQTIINSTKDVMDEQNSPLAQQFDTMIQSSADKRRQATLSMIDQTLHEPAPQPTAPTPTSGGRNKKAKKRQNSDPWFLQQTPQPTDPNLTAIRDTQTVAPGAQPAVRSNVAGGPLNEADFLSKVHKKKAQDAMVTKNRNSHMKVVQPAGTQQTAKASANDDSNAQNTSITAGGVGTAQQHANATGIPPVDPGIMSLSQNDDLNIETLARQANKAADLGDDEVVISLHDN